jgi:hypothetical protein
MSPLEISNRELLGFFAVALPLAAAYAFILYRLYASILRKGYQSPFLTFAMLSVFFASILLGGLCASMAPGLCWSCTPAQNPETYQVALIWPHIWQFARYFSVGSVLPVLAAVVIAPLVPTRARTFGARRVRMPWRPLSRLFLVLIPLATLASLIWQLGFSNWFRISVLLLFAYRGCAYMAKRLSAPGLQTALQEDARLPVFYLRAFAGEDKPFTTLSYGECETFGVPMLNPQAWRHPATLEQYFDVHIRQQVGPFVALGDPYDYAPPGGASRDYFADDNWIAAFHDLAQRCRFAIMRAGDASDNVRRELGMLRDSGLLSKLFVVTQPSRRRYILPKSWAIAADQRSWKKFSDVLSACSINACPYPGLGSVVTFESSAAIPVSSGATSPGDYVVAILARIAGTSGQGSP